ncbi:MAG: zinc-ribbon domain-containing protein [Candidatus Berkelbacteria bacterium]|nr:zinc-ribbon domain-containing protein [Candidatus Berkelbacteria bacterium]
MELKDQNLVCQDCGKEFVFTANDQKFFEEKGYQPPKRCPDCRKAKKQAKSSGQKYEITCSKCGEKGYVPFEPKNPEGLLCENCFRESRDK